MNLKFVVVMLLLLDNHSLLHFGLNSRGVVSRCNVVLKNKLNFHNNELAITDFVSRPLASKGYRKILGQSIMECRSFKVDGLKSFKFDGSFREVEAMPRMAIPEIALLGRSNVGKSSLLNSLTGLHRNIAVESKTPGRTRCINLFSVKDKEGDICVLADLPGYGFAKISKTDKLVINLLVRDYLRKRDLLKAALVLVDVRRTVQQSDLDLMRVMTVPIDQYFLFSNHDWFFRRFGRTLLCPSSW